MIYLVSLTLFGSFTIEVQLPGERIFDNTSTNFAT
jgi:hypothetical protein